MDNLNSILSGSLIFREKGNELSRITPSTNAVEITGSLRVKGNNILLNGSDLAYRIKHWKLDKELIKLLLEILHFGPVL